MPALPIIGTIATVGSAYNQYKQGKEAQKAMEKAAANAQPISWNEALQRAQDINNPIWNDQIKNTLQQQNYANMSRGFYGQAPGDAINAEILNDLETSRINAINDLAQRIQSNSAFSAQNEFNNAVALANQRMATPSLWNVLSSGVDAVNKGGVIPDFGAIFNTKKPQGQETAKALPDVSPYKPTDVDDKGYAFVGYQRHKPIGKTNSYDSYSDPYGSR